MLPEEFGDFVMRGNFGEHRLKLSHTTVSIAAAPEGKGRSSVKFQDTFAIIDTGASHCVVSPEFSKALGLRVVDLGAQYQGAGKIEQTANEARAVIAISDGSRRIARVLQVAVLPIPFELHCILGMDMLRDGRLTLDGVTGTWNWKLQNRAPWAPVSMEANLG